MFMIIIFNLTQQFMGSDTLYNIYTINGYFTLTKLNVYYLWWYLQFFKFSNYYIMKCHLNINFKSRPRIYGLTQRRAQNFYSEGIVNKLLYILCFILSLSNTKLKFLFRIISFLELLYIFYQSFNFCLLRKLSWIINHSKNKIIIYFIKW